MPLLVNYEFNCVLSRKLGTVFLVTAFCGGGGRAMLKALVLCGVVAAGPVSAVAAVAYRPVTTETPERGRVVQAPIGGTIWERADVVGVPAVAIEGPVNANWGGLEAVNLVQGQKLIIIRERKLKACAATSTITFQGMTSNGFTGCLIDDQDDGVFDKVSYNDVGFSKKLDPGVPYVRTTGEMTGGNTPSFKRSLKFLGGGSGTLRLSYREFSNDTARPAFTEELSVPLSAEFPQEVAVKDIRLSLIKLDGMGLTYKIQP